MYSTNCWTRKGFSSESKWLPILRIPFDLGDLAGPRPRSFADSQDAQLDLSIPRPERSTETHSSLPRTSCGTFVVLWCRSVRAGRSKLICRNLGDRMLKNDEQENEQERQKNTEYKKDEQKRLENNGKKIKSMPKKMVAVHNSIRWPTSHSKMHVKWNINKMVAVHISRRGQKSHSKMHQKLPSTKKVVFLLAPPILECRFWVLGGGCFWDCCWLC